MEPTRGAPSSAFEVADAPNGLRIVRVSGPLDLSTVEKLDAVLDEAFRASPTAVRLDLSRATFLDSSGLRAVIRAYRSSTTTGIPFDVVPGPPAVRRVLEITGVADRLTFAPGSREPVPPPSEPTPGDPVPPPRDPTPREPDPTPTEPPPGDPMPPPFPTPTGSDD